VRDGPPGTGLQGRAIEIYLKKVWDWAEGKLTTEEIKNKFLLGTDSGGMTVGHWVALDGNLETLQKLWAWAEEKLTIEEIIYFY